MPNCPVCSSGMVYPLLNTWRCKRCKYIWKEGWETTGSPDPDTSPKVRTRTDPLETRLEKILNEYLTWSRGKFSITTMTWQSGEISQELFRRYLRQCVNNRILTETKDRYGRIWYCR